MLSPASLLSSALINRNFALLWSGQAVSMIGDWISNTALILWITTRLAHGQSWAPLAVSGVLLATATPTLLVGPLAGVFVDRWDKRRTMRVMDALRAVLIVLLVPLSGAVPLPGLPAGHLPATWPLGAIYAVVVLTTLCAQFFNPGRLALIGAIVAEPYRARAFSLGQVTANLAIIIGPPLAALLYFGLGVQWTLILNALSFVVSFLALSAMRVQATTATAVDDRRAPVLGGFRAGLHFFAHNRVLVVIAVTTALIMLGGGALNALDIFFLTQNLHAPARLYGALDAAAGVGAVGGAVLAGLCAQRIGVARLFWLSALAMGMLDIIYARLTAFSPALLVLCAHGVANAVLNVASSPLLLHVTPPAFVGRVSAVLTPLMNLASLLSVAGAGYLASTVLHDFHLTFFDMPLGPIDAIFTAGGILAVGGGIYAMAGLRGAVLAMQPPVTPETASEAP